MFDYQWQWKVFLKGAFLKLHYMREHLALNLGPLIRYFMLGKIQEQRQSAGNYSNSLSSSETTREVFTLKDNLFKFWFIGFSEGDGSFIINKNGYLEFKITQSSKDAQILFYIKKSLSFGLVRVQDIINNTHCFRVRDREGLYKIIFIFNGNIFLETRKQQFQLFVDAYYNKYKESIIYLKSEFKPTLKDSWLSGFTDADGCFTCSILKDIDVPRKTSLIRLRYILSQKSISDQMDYLADILNGKKQYLKSYDGYNVVVNTTKLFSIINYLKIYPLKTKKNIVF